MISHLFNSPWAYCKNQKPGNAMLLLRTHLWLPSTFRRAQLPSPGLSLMALLSHLPPRSGSGVHLSHSKHRSSLSSYPTWLCLYFSTLPILWSPTLGIILPSLCLAKSFSTFRKLKHHLFQKAFPESPSWSQNASHFFAPKVLLLQ